MINLLLILLLILSSNALLRDRYSHHIIGRRTTSSPSSPSLPTPSSSSSSSSSQYKYMLTATTTSTNYKLNIPISTHKGKTSQLIVSDWEKDLRTAIASRQVKVAIDMLSAINTTTLNNGRDVLYIIVETCRRSNAFSILFDLLEALQHCEIHSNEDDIMPFLSDSANKGNMRQAYKIVQWFHQKDIELTAKTYSTLLKGFGRQGDTELVDTVLGQCLQKGVRADLILLNSAMDAYIRCGENEKAIAVFDSCQADSNSQSLGLTFLSSEYPSIVTSFARLFAHSNLNPNINTYNTLLKGINNMKLQAFDVCNGVIALMKTNNIQPNSITINTVVDICVNRGDMSGALWYLDNGTILPSVEGYTSIIAGLSANGDFTKSFQVLEIMMSRNVYPNSHTLTSLISALVSDGKLNKAKKLMNTIQSTYAQQLTAAEIFAVKESYVIGLCNLALRSDHNEKKIILVEARRLLIQMASTSNKISTVLMNSFIQGICSFETPLIDQAFAIVNAMLKDNFLLDDYTYSIIFNAAGKVGYVNEALNLYHSTERVFDIVSINALIHAFAKGPNAIDAIQLFYEIQSASSKHQLFKPDKLTFTILFHSISKLIAPPVASNNVGSSDIDIVELFYSDNDEDASKNVMTTNEASYIEPPNNELPRPTSIIGQAVYDVNFDNIPKAYEQKVITSESKLTAIETSDPDRLLSKIFIAMTQEYKIELDDIIITVLNSIFSIKKSPSGGLFKGISSQTARYIFEELVISGYDPKRLTNILSSCKYPIRYEKELLNDIEAVNKLRKSATSARIFRKYGWNSVESGWTPFF